jgi:RNA polymerase sigma factor (sigma-70 family)
MIDSDGSATDPPLSGSPASWSDEEWKQAATVAYRAAREVLDGDEDVEGAVQDVMVALWVLRNTPPESVEAWIKAVARNRARSLVAKKYRERSIVQRLRSTRGPSDEFCGFEDDVITEMVIQGLLTRLPDKQREAVELHYLSGLDRETTAKEMCISVNTVKTLLRRGLTHLREALAASDLEGRESRWGPRTREA